MIHLLLAVLVVCVVLWATGYLLNAFSIDNPIAGVIYVAVVLFLLTYIARAAGVSLPVF